MSVVKRDGDSPTISWIAICITMMKVNKESFICSRLKSPHPNYPGCEFKYKNYNNS